MVIILHSKTLAGVPPVLVATYTLLLVSIVNEVVESAKKYDLKEGGMALVGKFLNEVKQKIIQLYELLNLGRIGEVFGTKELILQKFP